jgi:hypothetical protein
VATVQINQTENRPLVSYITARQARSLDPARVEGVDEMLAYFKAVGTVLGLVAIWAVMVQLGA